MSFASLRRRLAHVLQIALGALLMANAIAQTAPTAEQLQIFQGLTPEQQQTVLQQVGGSPGTSNPAARQSQDSRPQTTETRPTRSGETTSSVAADTLGPDDLVVLELALPGTMVRGAVRSAGVLVDPSAETAPRRLRPVPEEPLSERETKRLNDIIALVRARNPYQLDKNGQLLLPGFAAIRLGGLTETQAVQRLSTDPELLGLDVSLSRLPVRKLGVEGLKPYGYNWFDASAAGIPIPNDGPVPVDYIVGPGDEFIVQLYGNQSRTHKLTVTREGRLPFPELGPITVGGLSFSAARAEIESRVSRQMIGVSANVSVGEMRSIGIFVAGEVRAPGSHAVAGWATITSALYSAGGVTSIASLRNIQLVRRGVVVRTLDLYELMLQGNRTGDVKLQSDDVVFVPPVGPTVSIRGEVKRPAIYELRGGETAAALLGMAGGATVEADPTRASMTRINNQYRREVLNIDFSSAESSAQLLRAGDDLLVARLRPQIDSGVILEGFVHRPGRVAWREGLRLTDVISSIDELKPQADSNWILIRRESGSDRRLEALGPDLAAAVANPGGPADVLLKPRDVITVFELAPGRERIIKPFLDELRLQAGAGRPIPIVRVEGRVKAPGDYPLQPDMKVSDLLRAGGNLDPAAYGGAAELARESIDANGVRQVKLVEINLAAILRGDALADTTLQAADLLLIKETPDWAVRQSVTLLGEVRFPGMYTFSRGETLLDVIERAGGLTSRAFQKGGIFTRVSLREREQAQLDRLADRTEIELGTISLQAAAANKEGSSQTLAVGKSLLSQIKESKAVGRLVINLKGMMEEGRESAKNVLLRDGDVLMVPAQAQEVTVIGEVQTVTSHLYNSSLGLDEYINLSGSTTRQADRSKIYVVRADGSVVSSKGGLLRRKFDVAIEPGDTIVVPLNTERMPRLPFWQAVTQIVYNLAVSVAAVNSF